MKVLKISFFRSTKEYTDSQGKKELRVVTCMVITMVNFIYVDKITKFHKDKDDKQKAQRILLARFLKRLKFPKEQRKMAWDFYRKSFKDKKIQV